jgi:hypothetical protein
LSSLTRQLGNVAEPARIIVVDASKNARNESLGRSLVASSRVPTGQVISFLGREERVAIRQRLRSLGDASLLEFAFRPGPSGNRNIILLLTSGENVLFVDDDIVCNVWEPASLRRATATTQDRGAARIALGGHIEAREIAFYSRREEVCENLVRSRVDLLNAHGAVLGRSIRSLANRPAGVDQRRACPHLRAAARGARRAVVRMTLSGIAGDTGATYPDRLLFSTGKWKDVLARSRRSFETAFKSREVCKVTDQYVVMHEIACMTGCMGLANTSLTPPFLPVGRNEDGLFGATLSAVDRQSVGCHVPYAVVHASPRLPQYSGGRFPSASETRSADLLMGLMHSWARQIRANDPRRRLMMLGEWLQHLAGLPRADFVRVTSLATLRTRERELRLIESALAEGGTYPAYWQRSLRSYRTRLLSHASKPAFLLPLEFHGARTISAGYEEFRQFARSAGELYVKWPTVWTEARRKLPGFAAD